MSEKTLRILKEFFGHKAFRPGQEALIEAILSGRDVLGVMPTGAGKSICYQVPALCMEGITLVISPLISLMKDQVAALKEAGVHAAFINSTLTAAQQQEALSRAENGAYQLIYVAPERLLTQSFLDFAAGQRISLIAVDEAHCVSQWGQDFRPSYLDIVRFVDALPRRPILAAFTATATEEVKRDVVRLLGLREPLSLTTGFDRPNLYFAVRREKNKTSWLTSYLSRREGKSGIVYCSTRKTVERVTEELRKAGFAATRYHAGLSDEERRRNQEDFAYDRATVMVATNAFGMGIDKSNVRFVIHYNMPKNLESYYQEAGRAGRDDAAADCILLYSVSDVITAKALITRADDREQVPEEERETLVKRDLMRLRQMEQYCETEDCLRGTLLSYFGEKGAEHCCNCGNCLRPQVEAEETGELVEEDITIPAQMILSCLRRFERDSYLRLGETAVVQILAGSRDKRILKQGYDRLSTYGLLKGTERTEIRSYIETLLRKGYLIRSTGDYPTLSTTAKANAVLRGEERVLWRHPAPEPEAASKQKAPVRKEKTPDSGLYEELRALRTELARKAHLPAYMIFSDATLIDMAEKRPQSMEAFLDVSGVGTKKAETYGEAFLAVLRTGKGTPETTAAWDPSHYPMNLLQELFGDAARFSPDAEARLERVIREKLNERSGEILLSRYRDHKTLQEIGEEHGVSRERIRQILEKALKRLRYKSVRTFLTGEGEELGKKSVGEDGEKAPLLLRPDQLACFPYDARGISVTAFARALTAMKEEGQKGTLTGPMITRWLLSMGLLREALSDEDNLLRRPTPSGERIGIWLETREKQTGERYTMVVLTELAQRTLVSQLPKLYDFLSQGKDDA